MTQVQDRPQLILINLDASWISADTVMMMVPLLRMWYSHLTGALTAQTVLLHTNMNGCSLLMFYSIKIVNNRPATANHWTCYVHSLLTESLFQLRTWGYKNMLLGDMGWFKSQACETFDNVCFVDWWCFYVLWRQKVLFLALFSPFLVNTTQASFSVLLQLTFLLKCPENVSQVSK